MDELYNRQSAQAIVRREKAKDVRALEDLSGRVALITGAAGGIGRAFAAALAAEGAGPLALVDTEAEGLEGTAAMLEGAGCEAMIFNTDVTDPGAVSETVRAVIDRCGRIDLLANVAGVGVMAPIEDLDLEDWKRVVDVDLYGTVHTIAAVYPHMLARRAGHIVNVASSSGLFYPVLYLAPYAAAKFAVVGLSEALRNEAVAYHVGVTCVCPGNVDTGLHWRTPIKGFAPGIKKYVEMTMAIAEGPHDTARSMVRAVKKGRFLVVTTPFARASYFVRRHFPTAWFACMKASAVLFARAAEKHRARGEVL